jgi:hypothetical protein
MICRTKNGSSPVKESIVTSPKSESVSADPKAIQSMEPIFFCISENGGMREEYQKGDNTVISARMMSGMGFGQVNITL